MTQGPPILESPALSPNGAKPPAGSSDPVLETGQIQGNIIPGFLKDHRTMLFLRIDDAKAFRPWLKALLPFVATGDEVLAFNRLFKAMRFRRQVECNTVKATWINVAFSFAGLTKIKNAGANIDLGFKDQAFKDDVAKRATDLGDPTDKQAEGNPANWRVGGTKDNTADLVLILESDSQADLFSEVERVENTIFSFQTASGPASSGLTLIYKQNGATLPGSLTGHEHFGFRDGVSQPGLRGLAADGTLITPRQSPHEPEDQGKPGQDLLWPGEFVFGYPGQDPKGPEITPPGKDRVAAGDVPAWAKNGSYLVFRRLRQDVGRFHQFLHDVAKKHTADPDLVGARLVGRWASGAPLVTHPKIDDPVEASNDCLNNNFEFEGDSPTDPSAPVKPNEIPGKSAASASAKTSASGSAIDAMCQNIPEPGNDPTSEAIPFAGHIRKAYPRNDTSTNVASLGEPDTQTHRLLRRGLPWGPASASNPHSPLHDDADRGLLFMCYQTSIELQFEFVTKNWVNNPGFKQDGAGHDMIIGQTNANGRDRQCKLQLAGSNGAAVDVTVNTKDFMKPKQNEWVVATGGGYYFSPSIDGLALLAGA